MLYTGDIASYDDSIARCSLCTSCVDMARWCFVSDRSRCNTRRPTTCMDLPPLFFLAQRRSFGLNTCDFVWSPVRRTEKKKRGRVRNFFGLFFPFKIYHTRLDRTSKGQRLYMASMSYKMPSTTLSVGRGYPINKCCNWR